MSDHAWTREHVAAAAADGLTAEEAERLDAHLRDCPECARALAEARELGGRLGSLFAPVRPGPALEDRVIQSLRDADARRRVLAGWRRKLAAGVAASVGIGLAGAGMSQLAGPGGLPLPSPAGVLASLEGRQISARQTALVLDSTAMTEEADRNAAAMAHDLGDRIRTEWSARAAGRPARGPDEESGRKTGGEGTVSQPSTPTVIDGSHSMEQKAIPKQRTPGRVNVNTVRSEEVSGNTMAYPSQILSYPSNPQPSGTATGQSARSGTEKIGPDAGGKSGYFNTWGSSSYAGNGPVFLQVDTTGADGGPGGSSADKTTNAPAGIYPWPASSYAGNYQLFGAAVDQSTTLSNLAGGSATGIQTSADQPARGTALALGYIKPADLKPALAPPESEALGGKRDGKRAPMAGESGKAPEPPAKPAAPAPAAPAAPVAANPAPAAPRKIVIRSGDMEFEVESFDSAVAAVTRLVNAIDGAFVATVNSEKLPNGKVKGSVVLRVPPERLDSLVLDLRKELGKAGELKGQRVGSQDITKQYTDLESRLRAARTMEARLLQIIKEGKGEIKQLLEAEKELGVWRTRIEECEGELRYYGNLVALSTLRLTLAEREIRSAAATTENERVQAGVEVEDVDKALQQALAAIAEAKGRVAKSELKQLAAGQFNATLHCELAPAAAGPFRDRLNQLGRVARLEIDRVQQSEGGIATREAKVTLGDTRFLVQFYNTANVAPRETTALLLAVADVSAGYQALREAVGKARGRVITSRLDEQDRQNVTAQLDFEVRRADEPAAQSAVAAAGEVVARNVTRAPDGDNLTDAKVLFRAALVSAARVKPRETTTLALEVSDVDAATAVFAAQVAEAKGRVAD